MRFIVYAPEFSENSGGIIALYKLNTLLNSLGHESSVCRFGDFVETNSKDIVIYPEIINGNPLMAKNVVRWVLNKVGVIGGNEDTWSEKDKVFYYSKQFCEDKNKCNILFCFDSRIDYFYSEETVKDIDNVVLFYKGRNYSIDTNRHPKNSIILDMYVHSMPMVKDILSRAKNFFTYDTDTYYSVVAMLCGCNSFVIKRDGLDADDFFEERELLRYGVSYDGKKTDIDRAGLISYLTSFEERSLDSVKNFLNSIDV
jgi:hypothetical protein